MKKLFDKAREYGRVSIFTTRSGEYACTIEFNTIDHVELVARSGTVSDVERALTLAIENAQKILDSLEQVVSTYKQLSNNK